MSLQQNAKQMQHVDASFVKGTLFEKRVGMNVYAAT